MAQQQSVRRQIFSGYGSLLLCRAESKIATSRVKRVKKRIKLMYLQLSQAY